MAKMGQPYTSGDWLVEEGKEDDFIAAWTDFTNWSLQNASGAEQFVLIRDSGDPRHFVSYGAWADAESVQEWRSASEFRERLGRCRALCERFEPTDFAVAASPSG